MSFKEHEVPDLGVQNEHVEDYTVRNIM